MSNDSRSEFYKALAKAQGAIEGAKKDTDNPFFKSKYADLASVWDACRKQLSENGIGVLQFPDFDPETKIVSVETILTHSAGYEKSFRTRVPLSKVDAQGVGSGITYARRYALMAAIGIAPEDDDGNAAAEKGYNANTGKRTSNSLKQEEAWAKFQDKVHNINGADAKRDYWERKDVQAAISAWPQNWRDAAQEYIENAIEDDLQKVAAE